MKKLTLLGFILITSLLSAQTSKWHINENVFIGKNVGYNNFGDLCIIVGGGETTEIKVNEDNMLWIVDYNEPYLNDNIAWLLRLYERDFIKTGNDTKANRKELISDIRGNLTTF